MSIDFATLQGLTIPEGVVTQITDSSGRVIWAAVTTKPVVLEVEKQTLTTYAGSTEYADEQFILLDIYPKTNGTVKVTYGGITKTITDTSGAEEPNAQQVYFGTFNGVSDSVATPTSGTLTIEGDYYAFAFGTYSADSKSTVGYCSCITAVVDMGEVESIPTYAFYKVVETWGGTEVFPDESEYFAELIIPNTVRSIENYAITLLHKQSYSSGTDSWHRSVAKKIIMLAETPPTVATDDEPFGDYGKDDFTIVVPKGCGNAYKTATGWSDYANYIVEAS